MPGRPYPPEPLTPAQVARLIATLRHPRLGAALLAAVADALAPRLAERVRQILAEDLSEAVEVILSLRRAG